MPTQTYTPIARQVLGSSNATITFTNIPDTYTDLIVVGDVTVTGSGDAYMRVGNGSLDTGSNYSRTWLIGSGTSALSGRESSGTFIYLNVNGINASDKIVYNLSLNNYSNTTTNKTILMRASHSLTDVAADVALWRSTSAINTISFVRSANAWATGSTFTLYGIKAGS
jgi:hypothetical protein